MTKKNSLAVVLISLWAIVSLIPDAGAAGARPHGITFSDDAMRKSFHAYVAYLESDPEKFAAHLATLEQLQNSEVRYHVVALGGNDDGVEGCLTSNGDTVYINLTNLGGPQEYASLNSRFAHEFEHARQFDDGELAFARDAKGGRWHPTKGTYDIGDEVKAWEMQLAASEPRDFWIRNKSVGPWVPSLLRLFADAPSVEEKTAILRSHGYGNRYPVLDSHVAFPPSAGYRSGALIRPAMRKDFFGRVYGPRTADGSTVAQTAPAVTAGESAMGTDDLR